MAVVGFGSCFAHGECKKRQEEAKFVRMAALPARQKAREMSCPRAGGISISSSRTDGAGELEQWEAVPGIRDGRRGGGGRAAHPCQAGSQRDGAGWGPGAWEDSVEEQARSHLSCRVRCPRCARRISSVVLGRQTSQVAPSPGCSCRNTWRQAESRDPWAGIAQNEQQSPRGRCSWHLPVTLLVITWIKRRL